MTAGRLVGVVVGAGAVIALLIEGRPESLAPQLGAAISVQVASGGAIEAVVPGGGPALAAASLRPGDPPVSGRVKLINRGPKAIRVSLVPAAPGGGRLDPAFAAALRLRVGSGRESRSGAIDAGAATVDVPGHGRRQIRLALWVDRAFADRDSLAGERISLTLKSRRRVLG